MTGQVKPKKNVLENSNTHVPNTSIQQSLANFGSNTHYDSFQNQSSLPSSNIMNSQYLRLNGGPGTGMLILEILSLLYPPVG